MHIATANAYNVSLEQLMTRQQNLGNAQEQLTSGKRVNRASDDPTAAARRSTRWHSSCSPFNTQGIGLIGIGATPANEHPTKSNIGLKSPPFPLPHSRTLN